MLEFPRGFEARPGKVAAAVDQQRQPYEAAVQRIPRLRPALETLLAIAVFG
jgi:hypothetical protein